MSATVGGHTVSAGSPLLAAGRCPWQHVRQTATQHGRLQDGQRPTPIGKGRMPYGRRGRLTPPPTAVSVKSENPVSGEVRKPPGRRSGRAARPRPLLVKKEVNARPACNVWGEDCPGESFMAN